MPELVGHGAGDGTVVARQNFSVFADIGDVDKTRLLEPAAALRDTDKSRIERAEPFSKGHVLVVTQRLIAPHQNGIFVHRRFDFGGYTGSNRLAEIDTR